MNKLIPKSRKAMALAGTASAAAVFGLAFLVTSYALPSPKPPPPTPDATQFAQLTQIIEHYGTTPAPPFTGTLNGFIFNAATPNNGGQKPPTSPPTPDPNLPCGGGIRTVPSPDGLYAGSTISDHGSPLVTSSSLDFDATYVPSNFTPQLIHSQGPGASGYVIVNQCMNTSGVALSTLGVGETWISLSEKSSEPGMQSAAAHFSIDRSAVSVPQIPAIYPRDQLETSTINCKPAIIIKPIFNGQHLYVYMHDDNSIWTVESWDLSVDELVKIAEGLK